MDFLKTKCKKCNGSVSKAYAQRGLNFIPL